MDSTSRLIAVITFGIFLLLAAAGGAFGQGVSARHYQTDIHQTEDGVNLQRLHLLVGNDGQMAVVVQRGPAGQTPVMVGVSGPRTYTDVDDDGIAAFCFTVDTTEGFAPGAGDQFIGQVSCFVWLGKDDDVMIETGNTPFGDATSPELRWCGEEHLATPPVDPNVRGT